LLKGILAQKKNITYHALKLSTFSWLLIFANV
jgi:hypothetical protein